MCVLDTLVSPAKIAEPIKAHLGCEMGVNCVINGGVDPPKGHF